MVVEFILRLDHGATVFFIKTRKIEVQAGCSYFFQNFETGLFQVCA